MHIVAIGWLYVALMMAITETSIVAGVLTLVLYGLLPVAIILYISGSKQRKRKREAEQAARHATAEQQTGTAQEKEIS
ncbi:MAG: hypothetical protein Q7T64_08310 [Lacisediminimonas sp.]|nr:hypothetical protein [Lacisediminimonas sp.]MDO8299686.1 hypothetical protein [Lacisediminimonas sp.]MDO9218192.1 hypothetical protein [Lacisediminimonas sp.]